jgi:hypothetical protein
MTTPAPAPVPLQIGYIDPDGNFWSLSDQSMQNGYICSGLAGIEGLPVSMQTVPLLDGTSYPNLYLPQPGSIAIAILITMPLTSQNEMDYYNLLDSIVRAFYTRRKELPAPGYLVVQRPDGTTRQIAVYTTSGLNTPEVGLNDMTLYSLTLETPDPYWTDANPQTLTFQQNVAAGILPMLPVSFASGAVLGTANIFNAGTATSFPTWSITGPGTPTIQNLTTGLSWSLNQQVPGGQVLQVVTKPGQQMVVNQSTGVSMWDALVASSLRQLWGLVPGNNQVNMQMAGASQATQIQLQWTNRWARA